VSMFFRVFAFGSGLESRLAAGPTAGFGAAGIGAAIAGTETTSATAGGAGNVTTTELPSAAACAAPGCDSRTVTRVSLLPISVTSSAVMALTPGGRVVGIVSVFDLIVPQRVVTKRSAVGL